MEQQIRERVASLLLKIGAVTFRFDPPYTYTSGIKSPIYLDNRLVMSYPEVRSEIIELYAQMIKEKIGMENVEWISATATAAIPQGALVADRLKIPMVFVRPSSKGHGKQAKMEGYMEKGKKVVIIEDHISTAGSVLNNAETIRELGGIVDYCVSTSTYETQASIDTLAANKITLIAMTTGKTILKMAEEEKYLTPEQKQDVEAWFADPQHWGDKFNSNT